MDKICGNCKHHEYEKIGADWLCNNEHSENYACWTGFEDNCGDYEERE